MSKNIKSVLSIARAWIGRKEADGSHKEIIDIYNESRPAGAYKMQYFDHWCATFVSACFIKAGYGSDFPVEVGCERMINLFAKKGAWVEDDAYMPKAGDIIFYDWQDNGIGDNKGWADHVGIVEKVSGNSITVIEGNIDDKVGRRHIKVGDRYIRGYGVPNLKASTPSLVNPVKNSDGAEIELGDIVLFKGNTHYTNSYNDGIPYMCKGGKAKVTRINKAGTHPYHLEHIDESSTVFGWVDEKDVVK